ncbi:Outer membrane protein assembly factor BamB [subsurface metagenome]
MKLKLLEKRTIILWLVSALLVSCLSLMGVGGVEAQASQEPEWSYNAGYTVSDVRISSDGNYIIINTTSSPGDNRLYLFSRSSSTPLWSYQAGAQINSIGISSDGSYIVEADAQGYICVFSRSSSTPIWSYYTGKWINSVAVSSDGNYIVAGDTWGNLYLLSRSTQTLAWNYNTGGYVSSVAISLDGNYIAALDTVSERLYLFSKSSSTPLWYYQASDMLLGNLDLVNLSSDGDYIVAGIGYNIIVFSRTSSTPLWNYPTQDWVVSVAISTNGFYIVAGGDDQYVHVFLYSSGIPLWSYQTGGDVYSVAISSDGSYITAGSQDDKVYLFNKGSSSPLWIYQTGSNVCSVSISSNGSYIAAVGGTKVYLFSRELPNTAPTLLWASLSPSSGSEGTAFTYEVTYADADGDAPSYVRVYIDGSSHTMSKVSGTYTGGALYRYTTSSLSTGSHTYYFTASDGIDTARLPTSGTYSDPTVTEEPATFQATITFYKPDGTPLTNTTIYYGISGGQETNLLGATDSQGKITSTNSALAGQTIYFKSSDGTYSGSTYVGSSGGSSNIWLTETSGAPMDEFPWAIVVVILIVGGVIGMLAFKKL